MLISARTLLYRKEASMLELEFLLYFSSFSANEKERLRSGALCYSRIDCLRGSWGYYWLCIKLAGIFILTIDYSEALTSFGNRTDVFYR